MGTNVKNIKQEPPMLERALRLLKLAYGVAFTNYGTKEPWQGNGVKHFIWPSTANAIPRLRGWYRQCETESGKPPNLLVTARAGRAFADFDLYKIEDETTRAEAEARVMAWVEATGAPAQRSGSGGIHVEVEDVRGFSSADLVRVFGCPGEFRRSGTLYVVGPGSFTLGDDTHRGGEYAELAGHEWDGRPAGALPAHASEQPREERQQAQQSAPSDDLPSPKELKALLKRIPADDYETWVKVGMVLKLEYPDKGLEYWDWWSKRAPDKYKSFEDCEAKWATFNPDGKRDIVRIGTLKLLAGTPTAAEDFPTVAGVDVGVGEPEEWWALHGVADVLNADPPAHDWILHGALLRGKVSILAGMGGIGKSILMYRIAMHYALGRPHALGYVERELFDPPRHHKTGRVLVLSAEDDADDIARRMHALAKALDLSVADRKRLKDRLAIVPLAAVDTRLLDDKGKPLFSKAVIKACANIDEGVDVIILDPSIAFNNGEVNSAAEVSQFMRACAQIALRTGAGVLVGAHTRKRSQSQANDPTVDDVLGSVAFTNAARSVFLVAAMPPAQAKEWGLKPEQAAQYVMLTTHKNNYAKFDRDDPIVLERGANGVLGGPAVPLMRLRATGDTKEQAKVEQQVAARERERKVEAMDNRSLMLDVLSEMRKPGFSKVAAQAKFGVGKDRMASVLRLSEDEGFHTTKGETKAMTYHLTAKGKALIAKGSSD